MRRYLLIAAGLLALLGPAKAADSSVPAMTAASALSGAELLYVVQGGADRKGTPAQVAAYINGLFNGDCTVTATGAISCTKTGGAVFGALATATSPMNSAVVPGGGTFAYSYVGCGGTADDAAGIN